MSGCWSGTDFSGPSQLWVLLDVWIQNFVSASFRFESTFAVGEKYWIRYQSVFALCTKLA